MKFRSCFLGLAILIALIPLHGFWYSTSVIRKYIQRCGAHPTLEAAVESNWQHNGFDPAWFEEYIKSQNSDQIPYTWYVVYRVKPEYQSVFQMAPKPETFCGGSFYEHTRSGWVAMPEHFLNAIGYLDFWMRVFHLYGGEL